VNILKNQKLIKKGYFMKKLFSIFIVFLFFAGINHLAYSENTVQPQDEQYSAFVSPKGNTFLPKTREQKEQLDKLMQLYMSGKSEEANKLEEGILEDPSFEKN